MVLVVPPEVERQRRDYVGGRLAKKLPRLMALTPPSDLNPRIDLPRIFLTTRSSVNSHRATTMCSGSVEKIAKDLRVAGRGPSDDAEFVADRRSVIRNRISVHAG
jgi:hypothetical protein